MTQAKPFEGKFTAKNGLIVSRPQPNDTPYVRVEDQQGERPDSFFFEPGKVEEVKFARRAAESYAAIAEFLEHELTNQPKPWHDAKVGQVWLMTDHYGHAKAYTVQRSGDALVFRRPVRYMETSSYALTVDIFVDGKLLYDPTDS